MAQDPNATIGKIIRINRDGTTQIWSTGHRNIQGAALDASGTLWTIEHGPRGGDELNNPRAGRNYGWPVISYGINYSGSDVGAGIAVQDGLEQPVYYWDPVIAPAGMAFYDGSYAPWRGDLFVGSLNPGALVRLKMQGGRVVGEERLIPQAGRIRDVEVAADGSLLVLTPDQILRVTPG
jgi:glucose/arabinose dehydrogenase